MASRTSQPLGWNPVTRKNLDIVFFRVDSRLLRRALKRVRIGGTGGIDETIGEGRLIPEIKVSDPRLFCRVKLRRQCIGFCVGRFFLWVRPRS